ncbi:MAG TPA: hypothetical protein VFM88_02645 [Vicinamibacteria bacterium]|nr:hypothetical protein [Vicinamibacteria bacterium]
MTSPLPDESQFHFDRGGPAYRLMQRIGVIRGEGPSLLRRMFWFLMITWVPMLLLSLFEGNALGATPRESFLLDFACYARFFVAVPLLILPEVVVGPRLTTAGLHFVRGGFVRTADAPAFSAAVARAIRRRESGWAELIILGIALVGAQTFSVQAAYGETTRGWQLVSAPDGARLSMAGFWYHFAAVPLIQFLGLRWIWRLGIWFAFLREMARLDLDLVPDHADEAGGLAFLGTAHTTLSIFAFGVGSVLSADAAFRIVYEGAGLQSFRVTFAAHLILWELFCLGPLLLFAPALARARRAGLRTYGVLVNRYNRAFFDKWVVGPAPEGEPLLGSADIQSLADLGNSYDRIRSMKLVPFTQRVVLQVAVVAALPSLPLVLLVIPVTEILKLLAGALL